MAVFNSILIGGGGFSRAMDSHPDGWLVSCVDVYGAYVADTSPSSVWRQLITDTSMPAATLDTTVWGQAAGGGGVLCARFAPSNSNIMYMLYSGIAGHFTAGLVVSTNRGVTWTDCNLGNFDAAANGGQSGSINYQIGIDPNDPNIVYVGLPNCGLFKTTNGLSGTSATWTLVNPTVFTTALSTSTTSNTPSIATKSFTVTAGLALNDGNGAVASEVLVYKTSNPAVWMIGHVSSYSGTSLSLVITKANGTGTHTDWTIAQSVDPGVSGILIDPTNSSRVIVGSRTNGIYVSANAGSTFSLISGSPVRPGHAKLGKDGTAYYTDNTNNANVWRLTNGNVLTNIGGGGGGYIVAVDPNDATRGICEQNGGLINIIASGSMNSGTPTWNGPNDTAGKQLYANTSIGQPAWIQNSNDAFLSEGDICWDPLSTSSSTSLTPNNGSFTFTVAAGQNIYVGDTLRLCSSAAPTAFIIGLVTAYSGTSCTVVVNKATSTTSTTIGTGTKVFTVAAGMNWQVGKLVTIEMSSTYYNTMSGTVVSYSGTTLTVNVTATANSGSAASWLIKQGDFGGTGAHTDWIIGKERIWYAYGCGVLYSDSYTGNCQQIWWAKCAGQESMVADCVVWPPGGDPVASCWDRPFWKLPNPATGVYAQNYGPAYSRGVAEVVFPPPIGIDYAKDNPSFIVALGAGSSPASKRSATSTDGGTTWTPFPTEPTAGLNTGVAIAASNTTNWMVARDNKIVRTIDAGTTWSTVSGAPTSGWAGGPGGTSAHILCADEVTSGVFYAYCYAGFPGLWVSTNGGTSMFRASVGNISTAVEGYLTQIKAIPGKAGHLIFCTGPGQGGSPHPNSNCLLYRTTNAQAGAGLTTWAAVPNVREPLTICAGAAKPGGGGYPAIYIMGWVNTGSGYDYGLWRSDDFEQTTPTWSKLTTFPARQNTNPGGGGWMDLPVVMAADPLTYNKVVIGYTASSFSMFDGTAGSTTFGPLKVGAGGWVTGGDIALSDNTTVVRTDTGGAFWWNGSSWIQLLRYQNFPAGKVGYKSYASGGGGPFDAQGAWPGSDMGTFDVAVANSDTNRCYVFFNGYVWRIDNLKSAPNHNITQTNFTQLVAGCFPNAQQSNVGDPYSGDRVGGKYMEVDPINPDHVIVGVGYSQGPFRTTNGGTTWTTPTGITPGTISTHIAFYKNSYVSGSTTPTVYIHSFGTGLYRSTDSGASFSLVTGGPLRITQMICDSTGIIWACDFDTDKLWKLSGSTWTSFTGFGGGSGNTWSVSENPVTGAIFYVAQGGAYGYTTNKTSFTTVANYNTMDILATDIPWLAATNEAYLSVGRLMFDNLGKALLTEGIGFFEKANPTTNVNWTSRSVGIEQLVNNEVTVPPGGKPIIANWDRPFFRLPIDTYPTGHGTSYLGAPIQFGASVDWAADNPLVIVGAGSDPGKSTDGGLTWSRFADQSVATISSGGNIIAISATNYLYITSGADVFRTTDGGATWTLCVFSGVPHGARILSAANNGSGAQRLTVDSTSGWSNGSYWIYNPSSGFTNPTLTIIDATHVDVVGSTFTGTFTGYIQPQSAPNWHNTYYIAERMGSADRVTANTAYIFNNTYPEGSVGGVWKTSNGGSTWTRIPGTAVAFAGTQTHLKTVPGYAGHVYFSAGNQGGSVAGTFKRNLTGFASGTWTDIPNVLEVLSFGFGAVEVGASYPTCFIAGWVNDGNGYRFGIWKSQNANATTPTWEFLTNYPGGNFDQIQDVAGDPNIPGQVYIGHIGSGLSAGIYSGTSINTYSISSVTGAFNMSGLAALLTRLIPAPVLHFRHRRV